MEVFEEITEDQLNELLTIHKSENLLISIPRADVNKIKAVKVTELEKERLANFQEYLFKLGFLEDNNFAALFAYVFNLAFTRHRQAAEIDAKKEQASG